MATVKANSDGILTPPGRWDSARYLLRKTRDECYIEAAFRSNHINEVFIFTGFHYFVVKYDAQSHSQKEPYVITKPPLLLVDGFYELYGCTGFRDSGVDAAFGCHGTNQAFLFSRIWGAKIEYNSDNEGRVVKVDGLRWFFMSPEDTKFSEGSLDAACESTVPGDAYLFKGSNYALVNYSNHSKLTLIKEGRIADEFTCLHSTLFESGIESAFASPKSNQFYFFKDNTYVLIEFDSEAKESRVIAGPQEIVPTNWPCLVSYLPYKKHKNPYPVQPKRWKPDFEVGGALICAPLERISSESKRKRKLADYALDATMTSGSSSKSMKTVEDQPYMQNGQRYSSHHIDAAFRSIRVNEVCMFTRSEYFAVRYDVDSRKVKHFTKAPLLLTDGFKELFDTRFCTHGVDAAFGCYGTDTAFLFSGNWIVKIKYDLNYEGWVVGLKDEVEGGTGMQGLFRFPGLLKDTKLFCQGYLDAACESTVPGEAYLFKGSCYALINYSKLKLIREGRIEEEFTCLRNTVFESEIGSAFASHTSNQLYFFKDNTYVLIEFDSETRGSRIIVGPEEIVPANWPCLEGVLPYKKDTEYTDDPFDQDVALSSRICDF